MEKEPEELLIKIILYLLLSFAFFSDFIGKKTGGKVDELPIIVFIFGILALIFLYIGYYSNKDINLKKAFGYIFSGAFILMFGWFLATYLKSNSSSWGGLLKTLFFMESLQCALLISLLLTYLIIKARNKKPKIK